MHQLAASLYLFAPLPSPVSEIVGDAGGFGCPVLEGRVEAESPLGQLASAYGFAPFTVAVAGSYFARLAARDPKLLAQARSHS